MISEELRVLDDKLHKVSDNITAAYNKITEKGGTPTGTSSLELAESIDTIPEGGGVNYWETPKGLEDLKTKVLFWDYDASLVYSADIAEVLSWTDYSVVDAKRKDRTAKGLEFLYWNTSLAFLQRKLRENPHPCDVGAYYTSIDRKGHFHFSIPCDNFKCGFFSNRTLTIDWGDGTSNTITNTSITHTYNKGEYDCSVAMNTDGQFGFVGDNTGKYMRGTVVFPYNFTTINTSYYCNNCWAENIIYPRMATQQGLLRYAYDAKIFIPSVLDGESLIPMNWSGATFVCLPAVLPWGANAWEASNAYRYNYYMKAESTSNKAVYKIAIGSRTKYVWYNDVIQLTNYFGPAGVLQARYIKEIQLPKKTGTYNETGARFSGDVGLISLIDFYERSGKYVAVIPNSTFSNCLQLSTPLKFDKVTSIGTGAFSNCYSLTEIDFSGQTAVPTLANINAFTNCKANFLIPDALYDTWIAATNWATMYTLEPSRFIRV